MPGCPSLNRSLQLENLCYNISSFFNSTGPAREYLHIGSDLHLARFLKQDGHFAHRYFLTLGLGVAMLLVLLLVVAASTPHLRSQIHRRARTLLCWGQGDQEESVVSRDD